MQGEQFFFLQLFFQVTYIHFGFLIIFGHYNEFLTIEVESVKFLFMLYSVFPLKVNNCIARNLERLVRRKRKLPKRVSGLRSVFLQPLLVQLAFNFHIQQYLSAAIMIDSFYLFLQACDHNNYVCYFF